MNRFILGLILIVAVSAQVTKEEEDALCAPFRNSPLDDLLANPPPVPSTSTMLGCLPKKLIDQFTGPGSTHVKFIIDCLENIDYCPNEGYRQVTNTLTDYFRTNQANILSGRNNHMNVRRTMDNLRTHHKTEYQRGLSLLA